MFSRNLNAYLEQLHMSKVELAKRCGVTRQAVNGWCNMNTIPRMGMIQKIAEVLHCSVEDLMGGGKTPVRVELEGILDELTDFELYEVMRYAKFVRSDGK